jgi:chemotaxis protein CheZ
VVNKAVNVVDLMKKTADEVLDKADHLSEQAETLEGKISQIDINDASLSTEINDSIDNIKNDVFDVIATQTFQDVARQKMKVIIKDLNQMRDWLIESLVVLNIRKDDSPENIKQKTVILRDVKESDSDDKDKQDLVDDLLAEFGF